MVTDKIDYVTRQLSRSLKKRFEHYVVTRIWHLLDDLSIKIITQQYVIRPNGRALTDLYFPQFKLHIEIDEMHHLGQIEQDQLREADIINATSHTILRVDTTKGIENLNMRINEIISRIKTAKREMSNFKPWNIESEQNPQTYIDKGFICVEDDVAFKYSYFAANCFGHNLKGFQRGAIKHLLEKDKNIWFPKLYKNKAWNNSISDDDNTIYEISVTPKGMKHKIQVFKENGVHKRIVFARVKSPLGDVMYRFKGEYQLSLEESNSVNGLVWKRISKKVQTYKQIS